MNIEFTPEQIATIEALAQRNGRTVADVMAQTVSFLIHSEHGYEDRLQHSIEQADRGEFIEEEEMDRRVAVMLQPR